MSLSIFDFISPKITLYYNGRNSHKSPIGGLLSLCLIFIISIYIFYIIWKLLVNPNITSSFIYEENLNTKINQNIDYTGINHFLQIYSNKDNGWFGDFDNKNIIIYSIKENQTYSFNNIYTNFSNIEHWLYDKCEKIYEINKNLFSNISKLIPNYSKSICLRYYYNPNTKEYYEIGLDGFISPYLETTEIFEKKNIYKIIIEKCLNDSFITKKMGYICNKENEINNYLNIYSELFIYFSNNQIIPMNYKSPFKEKFYSALSSINNNTYFENNIVFSPFKIITENLFFSKNTENISYIFNKGYSNDINNDQNKKQTIIGIIKFYLTNNLIIYHRKCFDFLEALSHLGGFTNILFFIFQIINYLNYHFVVLKNMVELFNINTGIDMNINNSDGNEFFFDKNHMTNNNYKIKVYNNNNNIINTEDMNHKLKNYYKKKIKSFKETPKINDKNVNLLNNAAKKKNDTFLSKRSQTKYINNVNEINLANKFLIKNKDNKRKSYLSQGYHLKRNENSIISKNHSIYENDLSNNEIISNNDRSFINNSNIIYVKEDLKNDSNRLSNELKFKNKKDKKKTKFKKGKNPNEKNDNISYILLRHLDNNVRHKSVNFTNQRKLLDNNYSVSNKNGFYLKNSSSIINDSSKQILVSNTKLPLVFYNNKAQFEKKNDNYSRIPTFINNNNDMFTNNNMASINNNSYIDPISYFKNIAQNKLKFHIADNKKSVNIFPKKIKFFDFIKSHFILTDKNENKIWLLNNFRNKLLSEEHIYRSFINLHLLQKIFQIDEAYKFEFSELYNNL